MPTQIHPHHHRPGEAHPAAGVPLSLLRMSALERLAGVAIVVSLIWAAVIWAMS